MKDLNVIYFVTKLNKKMFDRLRAIKNYEQIFLPTYKIHAFQISTLKLNFQAYATKRGNYVWWTKTVFCLICFCEDKKKIMLFLGQKYDHPRLQYFKLKLESSGNDSILRAEASFSWSKLTGYSFLPQLETAAEEVCQFFAKLL